MKKHEAMSLVNKFCKASEMELSLEEKERIASYIQMQDKNRTLGQTTLISEDADVMKELGKIIEKVQKT